MTKRAFSCYKTAMKVLKFGGTSVGTPERIKEIIEILKGYKNIAVIVSAFSGITDKLIETAKEAEKGNRSYKNDLKEIENRHLEAIKKLTKNRKKVALEVTQMLKELAQILNGVYLVKEVSKRTMDLVMSFGERLSAYIITNSIKNAEFLDSRKLIKTDDNFNYAKVQIEKSYKNIQEYFKKHKRLQIITGFIGSTDENETTTLGRGGSDYSAALFGAALNAEEIEIWTDVDGIKTADPRKVKKTFSLPNISYQEAMELSHFGAKVIHPPTMQPALNKKIPIRIKNTLNPSFIGSVISDKSTGDYPIKGISSISNIALLRLQGGGMVGVAGVSNRLFGALAKEKISVILISQASSEHSICFAIEPIATEKAKKVINEEFALEIQAKQIDPIIVEKDLSIIAVVGQNMRHSPGIAGKVFQALGRNGINIVAIAQGSSELNISAVINQKDESKALNAIHDAFFLSDTNSLNLFLVGTGLIGSTLLKQIAKEHDRLVKDQALEINLIALANSKKMIFNEDGISLTNWQNELEKSQTKSDIDEFIEKMQELNLINSIFIDATASEEIASKYEKILKASISIVTPNKKACSSDTERYLKLNLAVSKSNAKFFYETNVGAGLPILSTLNDLINSGDEILKIEAVLSGTLSYIFNSFDGKKSFSAIVKEAQEKGYTEPDPRDDLNGLDVGRKLLILARETGQLLDLKDINIENLVPENCHKAKNIDDFFVELKKSDSYFQKKLKEAQSKNKKLCYIASLEGKNAKVELKSIDQNHPFYSLSGSDNIISFTTSRYKDRPLVVKGPGAGAEVTAAGVFADILWASNSFLHHKAMHFSFDKKLKEKNLVISFIGMSNIGKTFWSKRLTKLGFKHINVDDLIETKLVPVLKKRGFKGINDMAKWLGQPYEPQFKENQAKYLSLENETMQEIFNQISKLKENVIIDTTGSVIYTNKKIIEQLKQHALVVYLEAPASFKKEMYKNFLKNPKPIVWDRLYKKLDHENEKKALERCYSELLEYRSNEYAKLADVTIPYHQIKEYGLNENQFMALITGKL